MRVAIIMGSVSDWDVMKGAVSTLQALDISCEAKVMSAHRTPDKALAFASQARNQGSEVIIAGAGGAAHLPGVLAAETTLPVIGVPIDSSPLNGLDALLAIVQMPAGIPVATMAVGAAGAKNAALMAASILSVADAEVAARLEQYRETMRAKVESAQLPAID